MDVHCACDQLNHKSIASFGYHAEMPAMPSNLVPGYDVKLKRHC